MSETKELSLSERMAQITAKQKDTPEARVDAAVVKEEEAASESTLKVAMQEQPIPEKLYHVFYSTLESCRMITKGGRNIAFVLGKYVTDVPEEIEYIQEEIALGNNRLSVVAGKEQMTADDLDPMKALKKQHIKEYLAEQKALEVAKLSGNLPESTSEAQKLKPGSTDDTANLSAE